MGISRDKLHKRRSTGGRRKVIRSKRKFELGRAPAQTKIGDRRIHLVRVRGGHYKHRALRLNEGHFIWPGEAATKRSRILNVVYNATSNELVRTNTLVKGCIVQIDATPFKQWYEQFYRIQIGKVKKEDEKKTKKDEKAPVPAKKDEKAPAKEEKPAPPKEEPKVEEAKKEEAPKGKGKAGKKEQKEAAKKEAKPAAKKDEPKEAGKKEAKPAAKKEEPKESAKKDSTKKDSTKKEAKAAAKKEDKKPADPSVPKGPSNHLKRKINARQKARVLEQGLKDQFNTGRLLAKISSRPGQSGRADGYILEGEELAFYLKKIDKKRS